jgi:tetratricopeptide (TPR) repeat protein
MRAAFAITLLILFAGSAAAQPGWSDDEYKAQGLRTELQKNPRDQKLILELALISENIDEIKAGLRMDNENLGAVSCHLAEVEMRLQHWDKMKSALYASFMAGCRTERYYQLLIELYRHVPTPPQERLDAMNEGLIYRPDDYVLLVEKSKALLLLHQPLEAEFCFEKAIRNQPLYLQNEFQNWIYLCHQENEDMCKIWLEKYFTLTNAPNYAMIAHFYRAWYNDYNKADYYIKLQMKHDSITIGTLSYWQLPTLMESGIISYNLGRKTEAYDTWLKMLENYTGQYQLIQYYLVNNEIVYGDLPPMVIESANINYSGEIFEKEIDELRRLNPDDQFLPFFRNMADYRWMNYALPKETDGFVMAHEALKHVPENLQNRDLVDYLAVLMYLYMGDTGYARTYFSIAKEHPRRPSFYYDIERILKY